MTRDRLEGCMPGLQDDVALRRELRDLEASYPRQPRAVQEQDLIEINQLRVRIGLPPVDERLVEIGAVEEVAAQPPARGTQEPAPARVDPHEEARALYHCYLEKVKELDRHRRYADRVVKATAGDGMTPVRPLATMGTGGGPLLCDHCKEPMRLEGGRFHGMAADDAWREHPAPPDSWVSWILGGLVVEIESNHTLRIYHGYPNRRGACCERVNARGLREHDSRPWFANERIVADFVRAELLPGATPAEKEELTRQILELLFGYDPGFGVNRPG